MALNVAATVSDITAALNALNRNSASESDYWTAMVNALYTRIKADMVVTGVVATAIPVATTGTATSQTGATTAPGTSQAGGGQGSIT